MPLLEVPRGRLQPARLDALTGMRFFAAAHVVAFHFARTAFPSAPAPVENLRASGYTAVSLFYVLSGFILAYHYLDRIDRDGARPFWIARIARVYPAYLFALLLLVPMALHPAWGALAFGPASTFAKLVTGCAHALMIQAFVPQLVTSWNLPGWSVSVEAFFYFCFPIVAVPLFKNAGKKRLAFAMAILWLASLAPAAGYLALDPDHTGTATVEASGFYINLLKFSPWIRLPEFLFGVALGRWFLLDLSLKRGGGWMATGGAAMVLASLAFSSHLPYPLLHNGLLVPAFALLVLGLARGGGLLGRALSVRPLVVLGDASYALYILQVPLMFWALQLLGAAHQPEGPAFFLAFFTVLSSASIACHRLIENPAQRVLKQMLTRLTTRKQPPEPQPIRITAAG